MDYIVSNPLDPLTSICDSRFKSTVHVRGGQSDAVRERLGERSIEHIRDNNSGPFAFDAVTTTTVATKHFDYVPYIEKVIGLK